MSGLALLALGAALALLAAIVILWEAGRIGSGSTLQKEALRRLHAMKPHERDSLFQSRLAVFVIGAFIALLGLARLIGWY